MTRVARQKNIPVQAIEVRLGRVTRALPEVTEGRRRVAVVQFTRHVRIRGDLTPQQEAELVDAGANCIIANTLRNSAVVEDHFELDTGS